MDKVTEYYRHHPQHAEGEAKANAEIAEGVLGYRLQGKLVWLLCEEAAAILAERFAIRLQLDGRSISSEEDAAANEGYNARMHREFLDRFELDPIELVFREVERKQKKRRKKNRPK